MHADARAINASNFTNSAIVACVRVLEYGPLSSSSVSGRVSETCTPLRQSRILNLTSWASTCMTAVLAVSAYSGAGMNFKDMC